MIAAKEIVGDRAGTVRSQRIWNYC